MLTIAAALGGVLLLLLAWRLVTAFDGVVSWVEFVASRPDDILQLTVDSVEAPGVSALHISLKKSD